MNMMSASSLSAITGLPSVALLRCWSVLGKKNFIRSSFEWYFFSKSGFRFFGQMPRKMWSPDCEKFLIEKWHELMVSSQGTRLTKQEKVTTVLQLLKQQANEEDWFADFTVEQIINKLESLCKKVKRIQDKFKKVTTTGSAVEDKCDLQVKKKRSKYT